MSPDGTAGLLDPGRSQGPGGDSFLGLDSCSSPFMSVTCKLSHFLALSGYFLVMSWSPWLPWTWKSDQRLADTQPPICDQKTYFVSSAGRFSSQPAMRHKKSGCSPRWHLFKLHNIYHLCNFSVYSSVVRSAFTSQNLPSCNLKRMGCSHSLALAHRAAAGVRTSLCLSALHYLNYLNYFSIAGSPKITFLNKACLPLKSYRLTADTCGKSVRA